MVLIIMLLIADTLFKLINFFHNMNRCTLLNLGSIDL